MVPSADEGVKRQILPVSCRLGRNTVALARGPFIPYAGFSPVRLEGSLVIMRPSAAVPGCAHLLFAAAPVY
jgi:hypothetical protein